MAPKHKATIIALANQKGGVAKTTSVASLGAAFAEQGRRVLLVDLDPQACLTFSLGRRPRRRRVLGARRARRAAWTSPTSSSRCEEGIDLVPSTIDLAGAEAVLLSRPAREYVLQGALDGVRRDYDIILLDCSPSLGVLTLNALTAAHGLIIPMPCEMLSHRGVGQLLDTVRDVKRILNKKLRGPRHPPDPLRRAQHALPRGARGRRRAATTCRCSCPPIPKTVRFAEAPAVGRSILSTARSVQGRRGLPRGRGRPSSRSSDRSPDGRARDSKDRATGIQCRYADHDTRTHRRLRDLGLPPGHHRAPRPAPRRHPHRHRVRRHLPLRHPHRARGVGRRPTSR